MEQKKTKDVTTKKAPPVATKFSAPRATSIREAKEKLSKGYYSRPSVLNKVAQRLLETLQLFTPLSSDTEKSAPSDPERSTTLPSSK